MAVAKKAVEKTAVSNNSKEVYAWANADGELGSSDSNRFSSLKNATDDFLFETDSNDEGSIWKLVKKIKHTSVAEEIK